MWTNMAKGLKKEPLGARIKKCTLGWPCDKATRADSSGGHKSWERHMEIAPRISVDERVRFGRPVVTGTRIPVDLVNGVME
jgi:hypothetical protein